LKFIHLIFFTKKEKADIKDLDETRFNFKIIIINILKVLDLI